MGLLGKAIEGSAQTFANTFARPHELNAARDAFKVILFGAASCFMVSQIALPIFSVLAQSFIWNGIALYVCYEAALTVRSVLQTQDPWTPHIVSFANNYISMMNTVCEKFEAFWGN